jgi:hypothetical protein
MQIGLTTSVVRPQRTGGVANVPSETTLRDSNNAVLRDSNGNQIEASS